MGRGKEKGRLWFSRPRIYTRTESQTLASYCTCKIVAHTMFFPDRVRRSRNGPSSNCVARGTHRLLRKSQSLAVPRPPFSHKFISHSPPRQRPLWSGLRWPHTQATGEDGGRRRGHYLNNNRFWETRGAPRRTDEGGEGDKIYPIFVEEVPIITLGKKCV